MYDTQRSNLFILTLALLVSVELSALSSEARAKGFVYLHEIDPTIITSLRYLSDDNFVGKPVDGYKKAVVILTDQTAQALKRVQKAVNKDGYTLVVYDAYRPQKAVDHFMRWSKNIEDQTRKSEYYPRINKADVFDLGYVAAKSGHSRGSTVDLTLMKLGQKPHEIKKKKRRLLDDYTIEFLDDGTVDMGSSFDLFDTASHGENDLIEKQYKQLRTYLRNMMVDNGFKTVAEEWWHFTLKNEPYPAHLDTSYFNFDIE